MTDYMTKRDDFIRRLLAIDAEIEALTKKRNDLFDEINKSDTGLDHHHINRAAGYLRAEARAIAETK